LGEEEIIKGIAMQTTAKVISESVTLYVIDKKQFRGFDVASGSL